MQLSDAQIERFSRQIILPEVGGVGQQRLLAATVAIGGAGESLATAARYLAGAGIGRLTVHGTEREPLAVALDGLGTETRVDRSAAAFGAGTPVDLLVGADLPIAAIDRATASRLPMIAGGTHDGGGWMAVATGDVACASCAARALADLAPSPPHRTATNEPHPLASSTAGVMGSLLALEAVKYLLGLARPRDAQWLHFDAATSTLLAHPLRRAVGCVCAAE